MSETITVKPSESSTKHPFASFCHAVYTFFAWIGEGVLRFPNKFFYVVLAILCILVPLFAIITVIALLCGTYRRRTLEF
jgi:hypothetical protein